MTAQAESILNGHRADDRGLCVGCLGWWRRLVPYPCSQADWATRMMGRALTERFLLIGPAR